MLSELLESRFPVTDELVEQTEDLFGDLVEQLNTVDVDNQHAPLV